MLLFVNLTGSADLKNLKLEVLKIDPDIEGIVSRYFTAGSLEDRKSRRCMVVNFLTKVTYIVANIVVFMLCDITLNGDFKHFGMKWVKWLQVRKYSS